MNHGSKKFLRQIVSVTPISEHWDTFTICRKIFYESQPTIFHYNFLQCKIICAILFITRKGENVYKSIIIYTLLMVYEAIIDLNMKVQYLFWFSIS